MPNTPTIASSSARPANVSTSARTESMSGRCLECDIVERDQRPNGDELFFVYSRDRGSDRGRQRGGGTGVGANDHEDVVGWILSERNIELDEVFGFVRPPFHLTCDAHDLSNLDHA